jgi:uncharacterized protein (TIGR03086 family)
MAPPADRFRAAARQFTDRADHVADAAWDAPAPCEGWVARDVIRHMVEWMPSFFPEGSGLDFTTVPSVDDDPAAAWRAFRDVLQRALDDPSVARRECDTPAGRYTVEDAIDRFCTPDVFLHTWDLARATGLDERLDADEVHRLLVEMEPLDEVLRSSGHYGPRVPVADDADEQTRLLAFIGRHP